MALALSLTGIETGYAQSAPTPTPTTKILAIGTINPGVDQAQVNAILPSEVKDTVNLYLEGKIEQFWFRENMGPMFLMNVATLDEAKGILGSLPLVAEGLMTYEYMPVTTLSPLGMLIQGK